MTMQLEHINRRFRQLGKLTVRFRWVVIVSFVIITGIALWGMTRIIIDTSNDNWFFEGDALKIATDEFNETFGNSAYPAILVEAEDVFAPEILQMIRELGDEMLDKVPFADEVYSLTEAELITGTEEGLLIEPIVPDDIPSTPAEVEEIRQRAFSKEFWYNRLFTTDSKMTWIILRLNSYPDDWRQNSQEDPEVSVGRTVREILAQEKYQQFHLKASGMPVLNYDKRSYVGKEMGRMMPLAFLIALIILAVALRSVRGVVVPLLSALVSILWVAGLNGWLGVKVDPVVIMVPMFLVLAVSIGYSIHVFNFFRQHFSRTGHRKEAIYYAIEHTGWPLCFTALTTMGALLAFVIVPITQVFWIGWASAGAVAANYILVMFLTPALLSFGKDRPPKRQAAARGKRSETWLAQFSQWILAHPLPIVGVFVVVVLFFGYGLPHMEVDQDMGNTWGFKPEWVRNLDYIRNTPLGAMYSYDLTLTFDEENLAKQPDVLQRFDQLAQEVNDLRLIKRVSSLLDIVKDLNQVMHAGDPAYYRIPDDSELVSQLLLLYEMSGGTQAEHYVDYEYRRLRLTAAIGDFSSKELEQELAVLNQRAKELFPDARFGVIGSAVQYAVMGNYVARGSVRSFLIALAVIMILMMLVFRSVKTGLIGMIPNITPAILVGGFMGLNHVTLDMMTMIVMPMLLGLAVDDTIHFITHAKLEFQRSGSYRAAVRETFVTVGKALFMTSFILVASFSVYLTSSARIFFYIGVLSILGITAALLADYFITPILVRWTQPFGKEAEKRQAAPAGHREYA
jgi:hydrophobe/amphiphile efflux-3 (HAE3) family protein